MAESARHHHARRQKRGDAERRYETAKARLEKGGSRLGRAVWTGYSKINDAESRGEILVRGD